jgi:transposase
MTKTGKIFIRYSLAFKRKIVQQIESGKYSISEIRKIYDIRGEATVQGWIKQFGKSYLLNRVIRIEMKGEKDKYKELEKEIQRLKSELADEYLKNKALEKLIELANEEYKTDLKKNLDTGSFSKSDKKKK